MSSGGIDQVPAAIPLNLVQGDSFARILAFKERSAIGVKTLIDVSSYDWEGEIGNEALTFTPGPASNQVTIRLTNAQSAALPVGNLHGYVKWSHAGAVENELRTLLDISVNVRTK